MVKKYRVVLQKLLGEEDVFKARMVDLSAPPDIVDKMIRENPVILKGDLTLGAARQYADAVQGAGGRVTIQEYGYFKDSMRINCSNSIASFQDFTMCPECGFKQRKGKICVRCGYILEEGKKEQGRQNDSGH